MLRDNVVGTKETRNGWEQNRRFLSDLHFYNEDGGSILLRNVSELLYHTAKDSGIENYSYKILATDENFERVGYEIFTGF
jgi:hypothetical protein